MEALPCTMRVALSADLTGTGDGESYGQLAAAKFFAT